MPELQLPADVGLLPEGKALWFTQRVTAPPLEIYQVGESAWLAFDPKQMTPIL